MISLPLCAHLVKRLRAWAREVPGIATRRCYTDLPHHAAVGAYAPSRGGSAPVLGTALSVRPHVFVCVRVRPCVSTLLPPRR